MRRAIRRISLLIVLLLLGACSTTRRIPAGEVLYTGVTKMHLRPDSGVVVTRAAQSAARNPLSAKPNNPLYSPYLRTPLPIGLWAWNWLYTPRERGVKYWLYRRLAKEPVLLSKVQPEVRTRMAVQELANHGYFGSQAEYHLHPRKQGEKTRVEYTLQIAPPWFYSEVRYPTSAGALGALIDSLHTTSPLRKGAQYNLDTLTQERTRIVRTLRNRGYYYFRPQYLEFLADTTFAPRQVALQLELKEGVPPAALRPYLIGSITVQLTDRRSGVVDTLPLSGAQLLTVQSPRVRPRILSEALTLQPGERFTLNAQNQTQNNLSRLGVFRSVTLSVTPLDSLRQADTLNIRIEAQMNDPIEIALEGDVTSKSNSFLGPGLSLRLSHNNLFRGGEVLALKLNGSYEWQTGKRRSDERGSRLNSYELGVDLTLDVPRLVALHRLSQRISRMQYTAFQLGVEVMNRPDFFRLVAFSGAASYRFQSSPVSHHTLQLLHLTYNKLLRTTESFDQTMAENPAIALSFQNQFVPSIGYIYTFDRSYGSRRLYLQNALTSAGNLLATTLRLFGEHPPQQLFGNRFSQFVKNVSEVKFYQQLDKGSTLLAARLLVGVGYAYGNSEVMPYSEQFYIGGANSLRAFTVRSIGPGSYRPSAATPNGYLDQTGDFKLEANLELRFPLAGKLHGAVFLDAGNIWLLHRDPARPGAQLDSRNFGREIALGTGFGLRFDISYLVLRADFGIGLHTPYPNPTRRGYYNLPRFRDGLGFHLAIGYPF